MGVSFTSQGFKFTDKHGEALSRSEANAKVKNRMKNIWMDFCLMWAYWINDFVPLHSVRNFVFMLMGGRMGKGSAIHMGGRFFDPSGIEIGQDSIIGHKSFLDGRDTLIIGNHVDIASEVMIYNSEHDIHSDDFHAIAAPVEIGDYSFVGPRAIILPGVKIGRGAVVAAGAVVTKSVSDFEIVGGVPAKVIGTRKNQTPHYHLGRARLFQ